MFSKVIVLLEYFDLFITFKLSGKNSQPYSKTLPIMLALCLMLSGTYYAKNYASMIRHAHIMPE